MVASSFPWFRQSSRDNPDPRVALRVDDGKQVVLDHPEQYIAILAVIATPVLTHHGGSSKARRAASKLTPCLAKFRATFSSSHSKS
jgi:hypothetical protein